MPRRRIATPVFLLILGLLLGAAPPPKPSDWFGFRMGDDFQLATWEKVAGYFREIDRSSDRVSLIELGESTEGRPFLAAVISGSATIANLEAHRQNQRKIADPRLIGPTDEGIFSKSLPVVLITCSIHSSETASTHTAVELLHELASSDEPAIREILEKVIVLLVPSVNPDGVDKVARWYARSKGKPWEGGGMPELYHLYAGHDTNRDWFMLNLRETQLLSKLLYRDWFPTIAYDIHQMGTRGARIFVPPFFDPVNPNLDPRVSQEIASIGSRMASDLATAGRKGVLTHAMYDNWWNGGNRTVPQRHNIVAVLTESASVRVASPIFLEKSDLRGGSRGFADHRPAVNFATPWPGGWWRLRDIVDDQLICCRSILTYAARFGPRLQENYAEMGRTAIARGLSEPPYAWVVPAEQADPGNADRMVRILQDTGIEARRASELFEADGATFPTGSIILPASQPYRSHLKDMMERQVYPERFAANGQAEPPYDVAGWTLPLQMGVDAIAITNPFPSKSEPLDRLPGPAPILQEGATGLYRIDNRSVDDFKAVNALIAGGYKLVLRHRTLPTPKGPEASPIFVEAPPSAKDSLAALLAGTSSRLTALGEEEFRRPVVGETRYQLKAPRLGLFKPWVPSMDEGWTRLVLESTGFRPKSLDNASIRVGNLRARFDAIILPSVSSDTIRDGWGVDETEPAFVGGLGQVGRAALADFVEAGGTLICLENSCQYAIESFSLPVVDCLRGLKTSEFYGPGSIVGLTTAANEPLAAGYPARSSAYFDRSHAFDVTQANPGPTGPSPTVISRYAGADVLESGWLLGADRMKGKGAMISCPKGSGRVILFGFPPQHRGQTVGTFRLLFNSIVQSAWVVMPD